ncbi:MAG: ABC transporter permease [Planctomycetales bacterium]|nr:ABC transporter permease [Planctomycetales bacterium]
MTLSIPFQLFRKEFRQLLPLLVSLVMLCIVLHVSLSVAANRGLAQSMRVLLFLGLPALFSVGAGPTLIGTEKESRTLTWLACLPIGRHRLIIGKLLTAHVGWLIAWLLSCLIYAIAESARDGRFEDLNGVISSSSLGLITWIMHSWYVLLVGLVLAWYCESVLLSLLLLIPLSSVPSVFVNLLPPSLHAVGEALTYCTLILVAVALSYQAGVWYLKAKPDSRSWSYRISRTQWHSRYAAFDLSPLAALMWQHVRQNWLLFSLIGVLIVACPWFCTDSHSPHYRPEIVELCFFAAALPASLLGLSSCYSDNYRRQVLFLVQRGVRPVRVWFSRHFVNLSLLACLLMLVLIARCITTVWKENASWHAAVSLELPTVIGPLSLLLLGVYAISAWLSQLIPSRLLSLLIIPIVSVTIGLAVLESVNRQLHFGLLFWFAVGGLLLISAYQSRRWSYQEFDRRYWIRHLVAMATFMAVLAGVNVTSSTFSALVFHGQQFPADILSTHQEIGAYREQLSAVGVRPRMENVAGLQLRTEDGDALDVASQIEVARAQLSKSTIPMAMSPDDYLLLVSHGTLARSQYVFFEDTARRQTAKNNYAAILPFASDLVVQLRESTPWYYQNWLEEIEIWLTFELRQPICRELLTREQRKLICQRLADSKQRDDARRRILALYDSQAFSSVGRLDVPFCTQRLTCLYWKLLETPAEQLNAKREKIYELTVYPPAYGQGDLGRFFVADNVDQYLFPLKQKWVWGGFVGNHWRAGWEQQAKELYAEFSSYEMEVR